MPTKKFSVAEHEPKNLEVSWKGAWKMVKVTFQGAPLMDFATGALLISYRL